MLLRSGTPHVLSAEVPQLPMNAPRVVRRVRGDFTAGVQVLGRLHIDIRAAIIRYSEEAGYLAEHFADAVRNQCGGKVCVGPHARKTRKR